MSNELVNGRYVLDTTGEIAATGTILRLASIWFIGGANEDDCILNDAAGKLIWSCKLGTLLTGIGNQVGHDFGRNGTIVNGLNLATIDGGNLIIYLDRR